MEYAELSPPVQAVLDDLQIARETRDFGLVNARLRQIVEAAQSATSADIFDLIRHLVERGWGVRQDILASLGPDRSDFLDDLAQDVCLTVFRKIASIDPARPLLPWLQTVVKHRASDNIVRYRADAAHHISRPAYAEMTGSDAALDPPDVPDESDDLARVEFNLDLTRAISCAAPKRRALLRYLIESGFQIKATAAQFGCTTANVHAIWREFRARCLKSLRPTSRPWGPQYRPLPLAGVKPA